MNEILDFTDEQLEFIVDRLTNNKPKNIDRIKLFNKIDYNMEKFLKECDSKEKFQNFRKKLNKNQFQVFRYIVGMSTIKIPNKFY